MARLWHGSTRVADRQAYLAYLQRSGLQAYRETSGHRGSFVLVREADGLAEFLLISLWQDEAAIRRFAGNDITRAVFFPDDDRYLTDRDLRVTHYDVPASDF